MMSAMFLLLLVGICQLTGAAAGDGEIDDYAIDFEQTDDTADWDDVDVTVPAAAATPDPKHEFAERGDFRANVVDCRVTGPHGNLKLFGPAKYALSNKVIRETAKCAANVFGKQGLTTASALEEIRYYLIKTATGKLFVYLEKCFGIPTNVGTVVQFMNCYFRAVKARNIQSGVTDKEIIATLTCASIKFNRPKLGTDSSARNEVRQDLLDAATGKILVFLEKIYNIQKNTVNAFSFFNCYFGAIQQEYPSWNEFD